MTFTTFDNSQLNQNLQGPSNLLDNGGFEIWQRGTSFSSPANNAYVCDRWQIQDTDSPTFTISREASTIDTGLYSCKLNITAPGSAAFIQLAQQIENPARYGGRTVTLSVRVWSSVATVVCIFDSVGGTSSAAHPGDSAWHTMTVSRSLSLGITNLFSILNIQVPMVSTMYFDSAILVIGSIPVTFVPLNPQQDLARCQRYYETSGTVSLWSASTSDGTFYNLSTSTIFAATKRTTPTIVVTYNDIRETGSTVDQQASYTKIIENQDAHGFNPRVFKSVAGNAPNELSISWTASADL
ncbi:MAG: hypothetical protein ACREBR_05695 [bacterium]